MHFGAKEEHIFWDVCISHTVSEILQLFHWIHMVSCCTQVSRSRPLIAECYHKCVVLRDIIALWVYKVFTLSGGSLGSCVEEEQSKLCKVLWIAGRSDYRLLECTLRLYSYSHVCQRVGSISIITFSVMGLRGSVVAVVSQWVCVGACYKVLFYTYTPDSRRRPVKVIGASELVRARRATFYGCAQKAHRVCAECLVLG